MTEESKNLLESLRTHKNLAVYQKGKLVDNIKWDEMDGVYRDNDNYGIMWTMEFLIRIAEGKEEGLELKVLK